MKVIKDIGDDQIRIIGEGARRRLPARVWVIIASVLALLVAGVCVMLLTGSEEKGAVQEPVEEVEPGYYEPVETPEPTGPNFLEPVEVQEEVGDAVDVAKPGYTEICDTVVNDVPMRVFIPHNAEMSLQLGRVDKNDTTLVYVAQAADVRADNGGIVGAFVLKGEPLSWGISKKGFCASINGVVTIGVEKNTSLFEQATEEGGYFFRQYPLVSDGRLVENEPKGKAIRRAICDRDGLIFMVESGNKESFHDFAQALVDLGARQAVYLVGSSAYGWAVDEDGVTHEFGDENYYRGYSRMPENTSYIVWRKKPVQ